MSDIEEGEIEDSPPHNASTTGFSGGEGKVSTGMGAFSDRHRSTGGYRSTAQAIDSSSESGSDGEENTPLWQQKKEKYFRKNKDVGPPHCPSPTLPEVNTSSSAAANKKRNNVWGSILLEQDLTHALVQDVNVKRIGDGNRERTVESYDFRNKYKDTRPDLDDSEDETKESVNMVDDSANTTRQSQYRGREIIGYNDTLLDNERKSKSRKRKANFDDDDRKKSVHNRLGGRLGNRLGERQSNKRVTTMTVGDIIVNEEMEIKPLAKIIADCIHEPKIELIERIAENMGKAAAIRIFNETRDVEEAGGMLTFDGSRRRTPGGVYLQLLKKQPEYNKDMYKLIFVEDNQFKKEQKRHKQRNRAKKKAEMDTENRGANSRSRSTSLEKPKHGNSAEQMDDGVNRNSESPEASEKMDCGDKGGKVQLNRKARSHSQSEDNVKEVDTQKEMSKLKSSRSKSFSYSDSSDSESEEEHAPKKSGDFDFQAELEAAKKLISKRRSEKAEGGKDVETMEETHDGVDDMNDDLKEAEANVVDIPLEG